MAAGSHGASGRGSAVESFERAGAVLVLYGAAGGLHEDFDQLWNLAVPGVVGIPATGDAFGAALAWGDFNGDGRADLAIGLPFRDVLGVEAAGAVQGLYGSATRLTATGNQQWSQATLNVLGEPEAGEHFGAALY